MGARQRSQRGPKATARWMCGVVVLAFGAALTAEAAANEPPRYVLKQERADAGTWILKDVVRSSTLPLNKTYAELAPEQQAALRRQYSGMPDADEPPFPAQGLAPLYREVAKGQQKRLARGPMVMFADIDAEGVARAVEIVQTPDPELGRYVAAVLMQQRFKPGLCGGSACAMQYPLRLDFDVR